MESRFEKIILMGIDSMLLAVWLGRDHLRSNMGITCGPGSFAVQFGDRLRSGIICGPGIICGLVQYPIQTLW